MEPVRCQPKSFDLSGLKGISDRTIEMHFKLYEGYVDAVNELTGKILENPQDLDLKRRLGFECNGMVLHEYYFGNLKKDGGGNPKEGSPFYKKAQDAFASFEAWKKDFVGTGQMRGVGWVVCCEDPSTGRLSNHWITLHEEGHIAGYRPLLVMDMWEHAFLLDYKPAEKGKYIEAFFSNVDWQNVEKRQSGRSRFSPGGFP